jgi:hypothetical protein
MDTASNMPVAYCDWDLKARSVFRIGETARARLRSDDRQRPQAAEEDLPANGLAMGAFRVGGTVATETEEQVPLRALELNKATEWPTLSESHKHA